MQPVQAYWDHETGVYFMDLVALFSVLDFEVETTGSVVRATSDGQTHEVDFAASSATYRVDGDLVRLDTLAANGVLLHANGFLLSLPNILVTLPAGVLEFDEQTLTIFPARSLFARTAAPFRLRSESPTHAHGPLLFGRRRRLIGGTQLSYRMTRAQRSGQDVNYSGFAQLQASAVGGRISVDGTLLRSAPGELASHLRSASYLLDFPNSAILRRVEVGRTQMYQWPVRRTYDGLRLSNLPLSTRNMQHEAEIKGIAEPDAVVAASVNGIVVDRVQADGQGRYLLRVPVYYGTSQADVEITPAGGGMTTIETRYLFIGEDLVPPGTFYWDLRAGQDRYDQSPFGFAQTRLGLTESLSAKGGFIYADTLFTGILGLIKNFGGFLNMGAEVSYPELGGRGTLHLYYDNVRLQGELEMAENPGVTYYRRRIQGQLGANFSKVSLFLNAGDFESFHGSGLTSLNASSTIRLSRRNNLQLTAGRTQTRAAHRTDFVPRLQWKTVLNRFVSVQRLRGRLGLQGDGGRYDDIDFAGITVYANYRSFTFGARFGYDFPAQTTTTAFTLRMDAPWMSLNSHSSLDPINPYQLQSVYGSLELSRGVRFSRHSRTFSSALLRAFVDLDRDGRWDLNEPPVTGMEFDVVKAHVRRYEDGSARVDFLVPSTQYQVVIDPRTMHEPGLILSTGNTFSFMSDPGETKRIDIPVYRNTIVEGRIEDLPLSSPTLAVVVFYLDTEEIARAAISQQGGFTALLAPGTYRLEVQDLLGTEDLGVYTRTLIIDAVEKQFLQLLPN